MPIDLNLLLLVVEMVLLIPTLLLLILGRREERGRRTLLQEITRTAKMVSRQEYFGHVQSSMQAATKSIKGSITGSLPKTAEQDEQVQKIVEQIRRARGRNVVVQYLVSKTQDRLTVAARYREAGAELRFHPGLLVSDIRYVVMDHKYTVLGLPSVAGENEPTREGYLIPSEGLGEIFLQQFESKWAQAVKYDEYLKEVLSEIRSHNPNVSVQLLSSQLRIPESEVKRILEEEQKSAVS